MGSLRSEVVDRPNVTTPDRHADPQEPPADRSGTARVLSTYWPLVALAVLVAVETVVARHLLFPAFSWNRDEPVYLWHMEVLRSGQLTSTDGGFPRSFRPWLTGAEDGVLFSQYTLGWPLVLLAAATLVGSPAAAMPLGAVLAVVGTYAFAREVTSDHRLALVSAAVMSACPIVAIQGGLYLGYLFTLGLGLLFAAALLSGVRRRRRGRIVAAGALLGWIFLTRPFDAALWGLAVVGYAAWTHRAEWRRLAGAAGWLSVGLAPLVAATLAYNVRITGTALEFPITAVDPLDTYGFGRRRIMPRLGVVDYDVALAAEGLARNGGWLPLFLTGSYLGVLVALGGLWLRRRQRSTLLLVALGLLFPLGYFPFWGTSLSSHYAKYTGPFYYLPLFAPLSILIATALLAAWRRRRPLGAVLVGAMVVATAVTAVNRFDVVRRQSEAQVPWKEARSAIDSPSLVFLAEDQPYLLFINPFASNDPELEGEVLFASDRGAANLDLMAEMPGRTALRQQASVELWQLFPRPDPVTPEITTTELEVLRGTEIALDAQTTNTTASPTVVASLVVDGEIVERRTLSTTSERGAVHSTRWLLRAPDGPRSEGAHTLEGRLGRAVVVVGFGESAAQARENPVARHRFPYRIEDGAAEVLLPAEEFREIWRTASVDWQRVLELPELEVEAAAVGGSDGS